MNLAYLAAYLRANGIETEIADFEVRPYSESSLHSLLAARRPDLVGVTCMTPTIKSGARLCSAVKAFSKDIPTVVGGAHANGLPVRTLEEFPSFDLLVYGEGEQTLLDVCRRIEGRNGFYGVAGLVWRDGDHIVRNPPRDLLEDLDSLPFPARDLLEEAPKSGHASRGFSNALRSTDVVTSRGCPFACTYCAVRATFGKSVRFRDLDCVEREIAELRERGGYEHFVILDSTFSLKQDRVLGLCDIFARHRVPSWSCDTRVDTISLELLRRMKASGCRKVAFGVESGSERVLELIGKHIRVAEVEQAVRWAREAGIESIEGNFIIGVHPSETPDDIEATRQMIRRLPWTFVSVSILVPFPGTPIYKTMTENGYFEQPLDWEDFVLFGRRPKWRTDHFSPDQLVELQRRLTREFYLNPSYVLGRLATIRSWRDAAYWLRAGTSYLRWYFTGRLGQN